MYVYVCACIYNSYSHAYTYMYVYNAPLLNAFLHSINKKFITHRVYSYKSHRLIQLYPWKHHITDMQR
jgi:hypothetical protein